MSTILEKIAAIESEVRTSGNSIIYQKFLGRLIHVVFVSTFLSGSTANLQISFF